MRELTREHPFQERWWQQLMIALYGSGRQVEALDTYRELRLLLNRELGIEPGPDAAAVHEAILSARLPLPAPTPAPAPAPAPAPVAVAVAVAGERPICRAWRFPARRSDGGKASSRCGRA
ncbi:hypothetical protein GCM10022224_005960 [Nonomuraea antimicrobica]|uniref:Bacterial transcriptional activator domain-containing protein n=1 Tax=Nonomuraea antimicrobica TaxID=561173 RepID=A0ABP7B2R2_9ACTN